MKKSLRSSEEPVETPTAGEPVELRDMAPDDYDAVMALWNSAAGVRANETREELARILERNPGLACVAMAGERLAAAVLCCHDGRRGYLYHLAVGPEFRRQGLGRRMVDRCLERLKADGIGRCTIFLVADNEAGERFWREMSFYERIDLKAFARDL